MNHTREWVNEEDQVMDIILNGFKELYQTQHLTSIFADDFNINWAAALSDDESHILSSMPSALEVHKALSSLKPYKASSMDGLHADLFQHFWHILGPSVIDEVLTAFSTTRVPSYLNQTLVVLIPKRNGPGSLGSF